MYKNRRHPAEVECRLFCCPILLSRCRFCSFLKLLSYRHTPERPLLFFLEEKQQKNIIFGTAALRASAGFAGARHKTDDSHTSRPFFVVRMKRDMREMPCRPTHPVSQCLLFLPFKKNEALLCRKKSSKRTSFSGQPIFVLLPVSRVRGTKRAAHIRAVRFS